MRFALFGLHRGSSIDPETLARRARLAEDAGFEALWVGDHVALPFDAPDAATQPRLEAVIALTYLAAVTERVGLGAGVIVLPQRQPVLLAKQLASLDVLSRGRLTVGIGVGYVERELRALGASLADRAARTDEYLAAMRALWEDEAPAYQGRHVAFEGVDARPRPVQRPLPVVVGGHTRAAHRRAARSADGWYGFMVGLRAMAEQRELMRAALEETGRERPLHVSVTPSRRVDEEVVGAYADLGVDRLIVAPPVGLALEELVEFVEANAPARVGGYPA